MLDNGDCSVIKTPLGKNIIIDGSLSSLGSYLVDVVLYKKVVAKVSVELKSK